MESSIDRVLVEPTRHAIPHLAFVLILQALQLYDNRFLRLDVSKVVIELNAHSIVCCRVFTDICSSQNVGQIYYTTA